MTMRIFVPRDAGAVAVGADEVATALERAAVKAGIAVEIVRTGSRGLYWLEPMVEVATSQGRVAFGPVTAADAPSVFDAMTAGGSHPLQLGLTERNSLAEAADPSDVRTLRRDRSPLGQGLPRA